MGFGRTARGRSFVYLPQLLLYRIGLCFCAAQLFKRCCVFMILSTTACRSCCYTALCWAPTRSCFSSDAACC